MIAVDTNILVYAHRADMRENASGQAALRRLMASGLTWGVPWPCVHEFLSTVTRASGRMRPTPMDAAVAAVQRLEGAEDVRFLSETPQHFGILTGLLDRSAVVGPKVHDARIAAICLGHGVDELWTADRDFSRFHELRTRNPLVG